MPAETHITNLLYRYAECIDTGQGYATRGDGVNEPLSVLDQGTGSSKIGRAHV